MQDMWQAGSKPVTHSLTPSWPLPLLKPDDPYLFTTDACMLERCVKCQTTLQTSTQRLQLGPTGRLLVVHCASPSHRFIPRFLVLAPTALSLQSALDRCTMLHSSLTESSAWILHHDVVLSNVALVSLVLVSLGRPGCLDFGQSTHTIHTNAQRECESMMMGS